MSTDVEKNTTFGATIEPPPGTTAGLNAAEQRAHLSTILEKDSIRGSLPLSAVSRPSSSSDTLTPSCSPANPFTTYDDQTQTPQTNRPTPAVTRNGLLATDEDLEHGNGGGYFPPISQQTTPSQHPGNGYDASKLSLEHTKECSMWPSPATLKAQQKQRKQLQRNKWNCWGRVTSRMTKPQKIILQVLIGLLIVGAAVGIGVGVSKAVGGGVWSGRGQSRTIPDSD